MFSEEEQQDILRLLAAVLHLGNLRFQGKTHSMPRDSIEDVLFSSDHYSKYGHMYHCQYQWTANRFEIIEGKKAEILHFELRMKYFQLDENGFRDGLLKRTIFAHGEAVVTPLSKEQAFDVR